MGAETHLHQRFGVWQTGGLKTVLGLVLLHGLTRLTVPPTRRSRMQITSLDQRFLDLLGARGGNGKPGPGWAVRACVVPSAVAARMSVAHGTALAGVAAGSAPAYYMAPPQVRETVKSPSPDGAYPPHGMNPAYRTVARPNGGGGAERDRE